MPAKPAAIAGGVWGRAPRLGRGDDMIGRRRWLYSTLGLIALSSSLLAGCDDKKADGGAAPGSSAAAAALTEWKVGAYLSLSGPETQFGVDTKEGIDLAIDEVNKAGGVKSKPIKVLYEDDKSNPQETSNKVLQLITRDKVIALLGEVASSRSRPGGIVANKHKIPMITPSSTNADITKIGPFVFRVCFIDDVQGRVGADFAVTKLAKKKIAILFASDDLYSTGLTTEFKKQAQKLGAEIVAEKSFLKTETNFTTYLSEIMAAKPEIIYAPVYYNHMVPIARQAKAAGIKGDMFLGGDGWDGVLTDAADEMEGAYMTNHYAPDMDSPNSKAFVAKYTERYKHEPTGLAAMGYDAAMVLADAIKRAKADTPEGIRDSIAETKNFVGATGSITINAERNAEKPVVIVQIKGKKYTFHSVVDDKT